MTSVITGTADTVIDSRASAAHAWLAGYSRGHRGMRAEAGRFSDPALQAEYERGNQLGRDHRAAVQEAIA